MARRPAPAVENDGFPVRPPLTPNDALRAEGRLPYRHGRSSFLRLVLDLADPVEQHEDLVSRIETLEKFVLDFRHHAQAKVLVEIGNRLGELTNGLSKQAAEEARNERDVAGLLDALDLDMDDREERQRRIDFLAAAAELVDDLAIHHDIERRGGEVRTLRKKLIDDAPNADEADAEKASSEELRKELATVETDRDALMAKVEDLEKEAAALRAHVKALANGIGQLYGEATRIAEDVFGATPVKG